MWSLDLKCTELNFFRNINSDLELSIFCVCLTNNSSVGKNLFSILNSAIDSSLNFKDTDM
jgi:hypothetical protein